MLKQCEIFCEKMKENGNMKTVRKFSYVALLCEKDGSSTMSVRCDYFENKMDVLQLINQEYPDWNIKGIYKLYEEDFKA